MNATRSHTLPEATNTTATILSPAQLLLRDVWAETQRRGLTRIGLSVTGLTSADNVQLALPLGQPGQLGDRDTSRLDATLDAIHDRFGNSSLRRAANLGRTVYEVPLLPD